jgi:DnaJ-class molecular chaperone
MRHYSKTIKVHRKQTVVMCDLCKGTGRYYKEELTDYHRGEYDSIRYDCKKCNSGGRLIVEEVTISMGPYTKKSEKPFDDFPDEEPDFYNIPYTLAE